MPSICVRYYPASKINSIGIVERNLIPEVYCYTTKICATHSNRGKYLRAVQRGKVETWVPQIAVWRAMVKALEQMSGIDYDMSL